MNSSRRNLYLVLNVLFWVTLASSVYAGNAEQNTYVRFVKQGMDLLKAADYSTARDAFTEALRYEDNDPAAHLGLGIVYFHLKDDREAERELTRSLVLDPNSSITYQWLGELYYRRDDLESAISSWEKALALNPSAEGLKARLERVKKEHRTEKDFNSDATGHFQIKYEGNERIEAGRIVLRILEDAYSEVGQGLSYYPYDQIQVILYSGKQFQEVTDAPGWSGGVYDGKIRIPIGGVEKETPGLRRLLFHEYTHAVVRAITPRCPTWLNEGLAQYFEGREMQDHDKEILKKMAQSGKLPQLSSLEGSFAKLDNKQAMLAYLYSLSAVRYIIDDFGLYRIKSMLDDIAAGSEPQTAITNSIMITYDGFEQGWKKSLE